MFDTLVQFLRFLAVLQAGVCEYLDQQSFGPMLLLAITCHVASAPLRRKNGLFIPYVFGAGSMLLYFLHCFVNQSDNFEWLFAALLRSLMLCEIGFGLCAIVLGTARVAAARIRSAEMRLAYALRSAISSAAVVSARLWASWLKFRQPPRVAAPQLSRVERLIRLAKEAQADFQAETAALETLSLDEDEREVLNLQAKQRLLQKLSQLGQK